MMNRISQQQDEVWTFPKAALARADLVSAEIVEKGIALQHTRGTDCAAEYLKANWIGMDIAMRVLSRHSKRRKFRQGSR